MLGVVGLTILLGCAFYFSQTFKQRVDVAQQDVKQYQQGVSDTSLGLRMTFAKNSWKAIKHSPWLGYGTGSFISEYKRAAGAGAFPTDNPHDEYLYMTIQLGLLGFVFLLAVFLVPWYCSRSLPEKPRMIIRGVVLSIALVHWLIHG